MAKSDNLNKAKESQYDEFYTRLEDIEAEISSHKDYVKQFYGKTVLCNCDDPEWSNFFLFFRNHFQQLKLKKLITTHYEGKEIIQKTVKTFDIDGNEIEKEISEEVQKPSYKIEWSGEMLNDDPINMITTPLKGNGDFRSEECIEILKEADIVVTNPPFSLFREYVKLLTEYNKKFVILGPLKATENKDFFPFLKNNTVTIGYEHGTKSFKVPENFDNTSTYELNGVKYAKFGNIWWYTNLKLDKTNEPLILTKNYKGNEKKYPKYDNYDAIEVNYVKDIPKDYFGEMGVPSSFLAYFCPEQFQIIGKSDTVNCPIVLDGKLRKNPGRFYIKGKRKQERLIIKRKITEEE